MYSQLAILHDNLSALSSCYAGRCGFGVIATQRVRDAEPDLNHNDYMVAVDRGSDQEQWGSRLSSAMWMM